MDRHKVSMGLLLLRLFGGALLIHGRSPVWSAMLHGEGGAFSDPFGVGGEFFWMLTLFSELICTILVMLGILTRFTAVPPLVVMVVTALMLPPTTDWAVRETCLLYALPFLALWFTGPGDYSVDGRVAAWATAR
jgi:putative oxidoreductase